jgi:uncharacterized membrane protein
MRYRRDVPTTTMPTARHDRLDALRALAMLWMAAFHFAFDLNYFGLIRQNFYADPLWTGQRTAIVSLFLLCAGAGQAIAIEQGQSTRRFARRWLQVAGCAVLVSIGSWWMFPSRWISFGVLHGIAVMLILLRLTAGWGRWLWPLGLVALVLPQVVAHPYFDTRWMNWVGLVTRKPATEDYVPLLPWLGVMWWGLAGGRWLLLRRRDRLAAPLPPALRPLAALGRWPLSFYMLHQPVLIGLVAAYVALRGAA